MSAEANRRIGDYEVLDELGAGGMGRVYRVRNVISDRIEAMKVLLPDLAGREELVARFLREIKLLASLDHPNIAVLRTALTAGNQLVMIMEYVEGTSLATRLKQGPVAVAEAVDYADQVLKALSYAHQRQVIHRDIKPSNMMLTPRGLVKLMDFGIARSGEDRSLTMTGTTLGSLGYMSPEQVKGETADARSDVYSVGISLYEMVTGQRPFQGDSDYAIMAAQIKEMPRPPIELQPGLPPALNAIILTAIAKDPAQRFQTADAFRNALSSMGTSVPMKRAAAAAASPSLQATTMDTVLPRALIHDAPAPASGSPVAPQPARMAADTMSPPPPSVQTAPSKSSRVLYIVLGAFLAIGSLAAAGIYARRAKAQPEAVSTSPKARQQVSPSNATPQTIPDSKPADSNPAGASGAVSGQDTNAAGGAARDEAAAQQAAQKAREEEAARKALERELDALEHEVDQLSVRAEAVNSSLDRLQREQNAAGYGLRGDMVARQASMKTNLSRAQDALERRDPARAKRYIDLTQSDVEALERFLGR